ncbi:MAG: extracellular solute-binding protein [Formivibrio sp.]|nr:extracellular solute-binding protein [Formivibrio sp.]
MKKIYCAICYFLLSSGFANVAGATETLRVLAWPGYVSNEAIRTFEAQHDVNVEVSFVNSDEELWSLASNKKGVSFDLMAVNTAELRRYVSAHLVIPIQLKNIPNTRKQTPRFRQLDAIPGIIQNGAPYAVPYTYSAMGLIYNRKLVSSAPRSMSAMWDPRYRNKVLAYHGGAHNFSLTALMLGYHDPFHLSASQFTQVVKQLRDLRDNVLKFYSTPEEVVQLFRDNEVALIYANYGDQQIQALQRAGADIGYAIPQEGALAWLDCWAILRRSNNPELAEAWINFMLTPEVSGQLTLNEGLANTLRDSPKPSMPDTGKLIWIQPVEDAAQRELYWARIMSGAPSKH